jgi:hypothetical protein
MANGSIPSILQEPSWDAYRSATLATWTGLLSCCAGISSVGRTIDGQAAQYHRPMRNGVTTAVSGMKSAAGLAFEIKGDSIPRAPATFR